MRHKFRVNSIVKTTEKISVNSPSNPSTWGFDIEKGAIGTIIQYLGPSDFVLTINQRYEVKFVINNCISIVLILFERQIEKLT
jgi:hypothetical protein